MAEDGTVSIVGAGSATITATFVPDSEHVAPSPDTVTITVEVAKAPSSASVSIDNWVYSQAANKPVVSNNPEQGAVTYSYSGTTVAGAAYGPTENAPTEAGSYTLKADIAATANYEGTMSSCNFAVQALKVVDKDPGDDAAVATIDGINASYPYTGSPIAPAPSVTVDGKLLSPGTDYDVSYENNTDKGTATVTITMKGNYSGTLTKTFDIVQNNPEDGNGSDKSSNGSDSSASSKSSNSSGSSTSNKQSGSTGSTTAKTGDACKPVLWIALMLIGMSGVMGVLIHEKKKAYRK